MHIDEKQYKIPILVGNDGEKLLDIQALYAQAKIFCYDPGYTITASCASSIANSTVDGNLYYRGYSVVELAQKSTYLEVCFILLYGQKPTKTQMLEFEDRVKDEMYIH